jgi:hypothetical protein
VIIFFAKRIGLSNQNIYEIIKKKLSYYDASCKALEDTENGHSGEVK